ncbi:MAG: hypothetical protein RIC87_12490 [Kiloniellales bacterium]
MKEAFITKRFQQKTLDLIAQANSIIDSYLAQGFVLTLRQLYYQFVARDLMENAKKSYEHLGRVVSDARLAGMIDWDAIEDRGRFLRGLDYQASPENAVVELRDAYRINPWDDQPYRPEVWVEKEALIGMIGSICDPFRVNYFACKGYNSQSEQWRAGQRFDYYAALGQTPLVLHLGDHDPSGLDMTRDNQERLQMFAGFTVEVRRLALNFDQIERYRPPPNFAKESDTRFAEYAARYGMDSWELDALAPPVIRDLITSEIDGLIDHDRWAASMAKEQAHREELGLVADLLGEAR